MPIYEFECKKCGETFEALRPVGDTGSKLSCPSCGAKKPTKRYCQVELATGRLAR